MHVDAVIFDLDGTLADTLRDIAQAMDRVLASAGLPTHDEDSYRGFVGRGARVLVQLALPEEARDQEEAVLAAFLADYGEHLVIATRPYPGVDALLETLASRAPRPRLAVLSNKPHDATQRVVATIFPHHPFDAVYGQRPDWPRKPDPASALALAAELGVEPTRCLFVGDTAVDMETALRAGMTPVGCLWGFRDREELIRAGAAALVSRPAEIDRLLDRSPTS
ncbi:MAG: HAD family hydrolase [Myxococcales bacterium]|nr:HAD family hydrolase [Myxococcales bacterium]